MSFMTTPIAPNIYTLNVYYIQILTIVQTWKKTFNLFNVEIVYDGYCIVGQINRHFNKLICNVLVCIRNHFYASFRLFFLETLLFIQIYTCSINPCFQRKFAQQDICDKLGTIFGKFQPGF